MASTRQLRAYRKLSDVLQREESAFEWLEIILRLQKVQGTNVIPQSSFSESYMFSLVPPRKYLNSMLKFIN